MNGESNYIMTNDMFNMLKSVDGFIAINGRTYQEHIIKILGKYIPSDLHDKIIKSDNYESALKILDDNNIVYTHHL